MACICEEYISLCVFLDPCNEGVELDITADETGTWTGQIEFNGTWISFEIDVVEDEKIIIGTHLLNENYIHEFRLYDVEGNLFACYKLQTMYTKGATNAIPIPSGDSVGFLAYIVVTGAPAIGLVNIGNGIFAKEIAEGASFTDSRLAGLIIPTAEIGGQSYTAATTNYTKAQASTTFTWVNGFSMTENDILILYTSE